MKHHKIPNVEITVCTAEQMIAYNLAFSAHDLYRKPFADASTEADRFAIVADMARTLTMRQFRKGINPDAVFASLNAGLYSFLSRNAAPIFFSYSEVGAAFPAPYLKVK